MKLIGALLALALLAGCQSATDAPKPPDAVEGAVAKVDPPFTSSETIIALNLPDNKKVVVGEDMNKAYEDLLAGRTGGFVSERLPPGFNHPYSAKSWQGAEDGFGLIAYEGKIVCAMQQELRSSLEHANNVRANYVSLMNGMEPEVIPGERVTYYFWNRDVEADGIVKGRQKLMIMVFQSPRTGVFLATAMGDERVMNALGMNEEEARADQISADKILSTQENGANREKT